MISPLLDWLVFSSQESCDGHWALTRVTSFMSPCGHCPLPRWTHVWHWSWNTTLRRSHLPRRTTQLRTGDHRMEPFTDEKDHPEKRVLKEQSAAERWHLQDLFKVWWIWINVTFVHLCSLPKLQVGPWHVTVLHFYLFIINWIFRENLNKL